MCWKKICISNLIQFFSSSAHCNQGIRNMGWLALSQKAPTPFFPILRDLTVTKFATVIFRTSWIFLLLFLSRGCYASSHRLTHIFSIGKNTPFSWNNFLKILIGTENMTTKLFLAIYFHIFSGQFLPSLETFLILLTRLQSRKSLWLCQKIFLFSLLRWCHRLEMRWEW